MDQPSCEHARSVYDEFARRCAAQSIAVWHCDLGGRIVAEPPAASKEEPALAPLKHEIELICRSFAQTPAPAPVELSPGKWLVPIEDKQGSRRLTLNAALVSGTDPQSIQQSAAMLQWMYDGIRRADSDSHTIDQFSEKLAQAYEETNLLYRMARLLNCSGDAAKSIESIGSQLQQVLPFGWMAIRFSAQAKGVRELAGRTIVAGKPPCEIAQLDALSAPLLSDQPPGERNKLLHPQRDPLAAATGAEVLAEPITHDGRVIGLLLAGNKSGPDPELSSFEMQFLDATAGFLSVFHENLSRFAEQQEMFLGTIRAMTAAIDAKDRYTRGHSERVGLMASKMAAAMGMDKQTVEQYRIAGLVHDVGKIGVPEAVLTKPGRLTEAEFDQIKLHPGIGHNILRDIPALAPVLPGVLSHHERWDGRGYPHQLVAEQIPLIAKVLALADTFDAMSSNRSYRPALPREKVLAEILRCGGTQFDPQLSPIFVTLDLSEFDRTLEQHRDAEQKAA
jgi:HD-GYP domain-containing protein (c-di-GMP phosphodiesterase class II)